MENCLVFKLFNTSTHLMGGSFSLKITGELSSLGVLRNTNPVPLKFSPIFLNYGQDFTHSLLSQRHVTPYRWISILVGDYLPGCVTLVNFSGPDSVVLHIKLKYLIAVASFLKYASWFRFTTLIDLFANDYVARAKRFEVTSCFISTKRNERLYLRLFVNELTVVPSLAMLYKSANWLEREVWDMYGVSFAGHPDLRRILTDYGFLGHPLRKDFPLTGFFELRYDDTSRRMVSERVNLTQELRLFFLATSWRSPF